MRLAQLSQAYTKQYLCIYCNDTLPQPIWQDVRADGLIHETRELNTVHYGTVILSESEESVTWIEILRSRSE